MHAAMRAQLLSGDGALHRLLEQLRMHGVMPEDAVRYDPSGLSAFNANTPEEWQQAMDKIRDTVGRSPGMCAGVRSVMNS